MKKVVSLSLKSDNEFFYNLNQYLLENSDIGIGYDINIHIEKIIAGTIKTIKEYVKEQTTDFRGMVEFNFEHKENTYPHYHFQLEENIDIALNRKTHTTTLERICDVIEKFILETANKQVAKS